MDSETVSVSEAARLLNVHRNTIHYRIQHGQIAAQKVLNGKGEYVWRIRRSSLQLDSSVSS